MNQPDILGESATQYPLSSRQRDASGLARAPKHVIPLVLRIKGELDVDALKGALDDVVERQEALRTQVTYDETDGNIGFQEVLPPLPVPLAMRDIAVPAGRSRDEVAVDLLIRPERRVDAVLRQAVGARHPLPVRRSRRGAHPAAAPPLL